MRIAVGIAMGILHVIMSMVNVWQAVMKDGQEGDAWKVARRVVVIRLYGPSTN